MSDDPALSELRQIADANENAVMAHIAEALGGSVESVFGIEAQGSTLSLTSEMLSLWLALKSDESRVVILEMLRAAVACPHSVAHVRS